MMKTAKGEIEYDKLGQIACCSTYHFQRMFTYIAGMPLSEYIRRRKMSLAAVDLQGAKQKLLTWQRSMVTLRLLRLTERSDLFMA